MFQMCYSQLVFWSISPDSLSVSQTSMGDSGHKGNTGQLLNLRGLGVLQVITLIMTQVLVCQSQSKLHSVHLPPTFCRG